MPLVNMRHVFLNEFSKHFYIQKSPSELLYIKHSVGDFGVLMGTEVPVPLLDLVGTEVPVPLLDLVGTEVPVPFCLFS